IVTHSELILERLATRLVIFDRGRVTCFEGGYSDFLERIGWDGEQRQEREKDDSTSSRATPKFGAKELRRLRAEITNERSRATSALRKTIDELENRIVALEAEVESHNEEMIALASGGDPQRMATLGRMAKEKNGAIESAFSELEQRSEELDRITAEFDVRLSELE
ncbi:MAG: hypothetical protein KDC38_16960, partial [Planctomycetes bacterium]|nr:hypothetical protein [Planctomycetota bacterium]